jgi:hypothetical protein
MRIFRVLAGLSLMLTAVVAYGVSVKTDYDKDYDLGKLKTFAFKEQSRSSKDPLSTNSLLDNRIKDALRSQLEARGYQYAQDGNADFLVCYFASSMERQNIQDFGYGFPRRWRWGFGPQIWTNYYTVGSVVVDFVDPSSKELIWRGIASQTVSGVNPSDKQVSKGVDDLLKHFVKDARETKKS